jgi:hypothetical protein
MRNVLPIGIFVLGVIILADIGIGRIIYNMGGKEFFDVYMFKKYPAISNAHILFQASITIALLLASLFVILTQRFSPTDRHWAFATIGTVIGFWLRGL